MFFNWVIGKKKCNDDFTLIFMFMKENIKHTLSVKSVNVFFSPFFTIFYF